MVVTTIVCTFGAALPDFQVLQKRQKVLPGRRPRDPMRDEGSAYAHKLLAAGVAVDHVCHEGMIHNFQAIGAVLPQGPLVLHQIAVPNALRGSGRTLEVVR